MVEAVTLLDIYCRHGTRLDQRRAIENLFKNISQRFVNCILRHAMCSLLEVLIDKIGQARREPKKPCGEEKEFRCNHKWSLFHKEASHWLDRHSVDKFHPPNRPAKIQSSRKAGNYKTEREGHLRD